MRVLAGIGVVAVKKAAAFLSLPQCRDEEVEARKHEQENERAHRLYHLNHSNHNVSRHEAAIFKSSIDIQGMEHA
ncbi:hypothetical protein VNO80_07857 [Phaseolus coccineus]|uniref:Uncharacterized protein n=1 Tax=Phaseolus coccineus TaxID=3886 RepID=A0AAN9NKF6_PHACN